MEENENLYNITKIRKYCVNPTTDGEFSWRSIFSYHTDSEDALDRWKNMLHEISSRCCACITRYVRWIGVEVSNPPQFDGTIEVKKIIA